MVHNAGRRGQDDVAELTGREQLDNPLLKIRKPDVVSRRDDSRLVQAAAESALVLISDPPPAGKLTGR